MTDDADRLLLRYRYPNGRLQAAMPLWSVAHDAARRVGWLPVGSEISYWSTPDGRDPRSLPLHRRFTDELTTKRRTWSGSDVLRVLFRDRPYQVMHFFNEGRFAGWYVNFESPGHWSGHILESRDWHLDLCIAPDGAARWKDEEEAAVALSRGHVKRHEVDLARATGDRIMSDLDQWLETVGDWRDFHPRLDCAPLALPGDWDDGHLNVL